MAQSAAETHLRRLLISQFRGSQPRITRVRPNRGCDFALQCRVTGARATDQFHKFNRILAVRYTEANVIGTFQGTFSPAVEIIFQMHVAIIVGDK